ncbi:MAG: hypothetical protein K8T89_14825 [Planctomycetes bacterium]|nr:hypothetical protein [Planctomycetota bacterium]
MAGCMMEIQDLHRVWEVDVKEVFEPIAAVAQCDPLLHLTHADLSRLPTQLFSEFLQRVEPRQIARAIARLGQGFFIGQTRLRIVDHADVDHAPIDLRSVGSLHQNPSRIQAHITAGFSGEVEIPLPRSRFAKHGTTAQMVTEFVPRRFGGALHRRLAESQTRQL